MLSGHFGLMKLKPRIAADGLGTEKIGVNHAAMQLEPDGRKMSQSAVKMGGDLVWGQDVALVFEAFNKPTLSPLAH